MNEPIRVYLDSSDYSVLSDGSRSSEQQLIRDQLLERAASGAVQFFFSGTHLMEMAPLNAGFAPAATARADLLVDLCRRNAVISFDRLMASELRRLRQLEQPLPQVTSAVGEWYPEWGNLVSPVQWVDAMKEVDLAGKSHGLNRAQRRQIKHGLFKRHQPKAGTRRFLIENEASSGYEEILQRFPMRPQDARILGQYAIGKASAAQANAAFLESLRDPRWMMRWFAQHHSQMSPFYEWLRGPGEKLLASVLQMTEAATRMRDLREQIGPSYNPDLLTKEGWARLEDESIGRIAQRLVASASPEISVAVTASDLDRHCPGLSTCLRSLYSAMRDVTSETPRQAKASDLADGLHALYAPYVSVFRTDSYMANHVRKYASRHGTSVVPKLTQLIPAIDERLAK